MGQNQSAKAPPQEEIKGPPPRPTELPTSRLVSDLGPKSPSYYNPANCVLPSVLTEIKDVQLRPVSHELSQYHPDFKEIFSSPDPNENDQSKEEVNINGNIPNGDVSHKGISNGSDSNAILSSSYPGMQSSFLSNGLPSSSNRGNGGSVENGVLVQSASGKVRGHRRQMSATSSLYIRETIPEDPNEESLEMRGKIDPISMDTSYNSQVSIPVKSSFDLDQSYNMTYAQLAEARRSKTLMDLEKRTGKKLEDLSNDLADNAEEGSFSRQPSVRSMKSAVSLDSGLKKKKRAPPPPNHPPPQPPTTAPQKTSATPPQRPTQPPQKKAHSFEEPPIDYDMDTLDYAQVKRSQSLRTPAIPPPPPPLTKSILKKSETSEPYRTNNQCPQSAIETKAQSAPSTPRSTSVYKSPPVLPPAAKANQTNPFLMEIHKKAEGISLRRQLSEQAENNKKATSAEPAVETVEKVEELNFTDISIAEDEPNLVFQSAPATPRETQNKYSPRPPPLVKQNSVDSGVIESANNESQKSEEKLQRQSSENSTTSAVSSNESNTTPATRRLNSLLQHDIKIAAQAKATKIVKHTTPVKEKPKDPAQVFREQLQKAAAEREARCKEGKTIDSQLAEQKEREQEENLVFKSDIVTVRRTESKKEVNEPREIGKKEIVNEKEEVEEFSRPKFMKKSSTAPSGLTVKNSRQRMPDSDEEDSSKSYRDSVYAGKDWVPEDDLSDDNLSDDQTMISPRSGMEGFKTSIIPQQVKDLKTKSKPPKVKEKKYKKNSDSSADERRKFDSIKKFKKSVHKSVRNAFGSISKASGKIMKKQKSEDFEIIQDPPRNWRLSASHSDPAFTRMMIPDDGGEDSSEDEESILESSISGSHSSCKASESNGRGDDEESEGDDDDDDIKDHDISTMKRAGVAYVNKKGQIVLLPEYETVNGSDRERFEGSAPKIIPKKKKFTFDATVRRKERELKHEIISKEVQEKEREREEEKQKEKETELEFRRQRELEARDRLQRLELQAQMQQQLLQQQQQQLGYLSAPPLPPPNGFQQGYNPAAFEFSNIMNQPGIQNGGIGVPFGGQPTFSGPMFSAGVPGMSYDLNDYMRMMQGLQQNQNNMTSAYAFMLNGSNWPNTMMDYSKMSTNSVQTDDSQRNEVYKTWQGPTKQVVPNPNSGTAQKYVVNSDNSGNQQYQSNGASDPSGKGDDSNSDVSVSEGLSPQRASMVAKIHVGDFRSSVTENNVGLFKSSISVPNLSNSSESTNYR
ncbi:protein split ends-like [Saccostrea echinata]|uniref:protein split ends-like n=1 Tax=Saccostrea echinata TaxID=191078 RepID=UPI002A8170C4|nr:protein split ends-like [Saccostrea echinata]